MDNVLIVVEDLTGAVEFFTRLGLQLAGSQTLNGSWVERVIGLEGVDQDVAMLRTPDGLGGVELVHFRAPEAIRSQPERPPANTLGTRRAMFAVDDVDATVERLLAGGAELVGEVVQFEDSYRLCYVRGPEGIVVGLAQAL
ncbi:VOC family protein [Modestobacter sp. I12A-02628]|uniref:VOC family protein n=1 Tax=Goekera deserti TaxID=2497753 RepID=A0A7K3WAZ6_9ACTN|nr:VOC family protein [Goekera deserti]NDI47776.1 VOC family protein [Goekera deserti]NEL53524.1 VOC family protein [Goekera deserti]